MNSRSLLPLLVLLAAPAARTAPEPGPEPAPVAWKQCLDQPAAWYGTAAAVRIADNVLEYQRADGGWHKNVDMAAPLGSDERAKLRSEKRKRDSTIDNGATCTQLAYLARVYEATELPRFREAFHAGFDYLLGAQYPNGGWPQYYPDLSGYYRHITYNDDAMVGVLTLLRPAGRGEPPYAFVDERRRDRAREAVRKGIDCILKTQVIVEGRRTAWCAQHDPQTLAPAPARSYELPSLSGSESVGIVRLLMSIDGPGEMVIEAVQSAVAWLDRVQLTGIRVEERRDPALPGGRDRVVVPDPNAPPLWARFYEIGTDRPFFCGRDGVKKYRLADIEHERRTGYAWYTDRPRRLLAEEYPAWQQRWSPGRSVLRR